ncbi:hypothetical protein BDW22DRAFT_1353891 [Trametopsis cervina]|nr:hypothetical protein BDW22DRAFT_1353891 [Trametopsis cervina]
MTRWPAPYVPLDSRIKLSERVCRSRTTSAQLWAARGAYKSAIAERLARRVVHVDVDVLLGCLVCLLTNLLGISEEEPLMIPNVQPRPTATF